MAGQILQGFRREIGVGHHQGRTVQKALVVGKVGGGQFFIDVHVGHGQDHVPRLVAEEEIRGRRPAGDVQGTAEVDAQALAGLRDEARVGVLPQGREQGDLDAQHPQVVGDVPPHAAHADGDAAGVGVPAHQRPGGAAADVDVHRPGHGHIAHLRQDVALADDVALLH